MNKVVSSTYRGVIDQVCAKVRTEFIESSVSEDVLEELRNVWESKAIEAGIVDVDYPEERPTTRLANDAPVAAAPWDTLQAAKRPRVEGTFLPSPAYTTASAAAPPSYPAAYPPQSGAPHPSIPQQDGAGDAPQPKDDTKDGPSAAAEEEEEVDNLDDVALTDEEEDAEEVEDFVLCTFEKVHRTKAKWKAALKNGIAHIDGRDYVFNRCNGEMQWQ